MLSKSICRLQPDFQKKINRFGQSKDKEIDLTSGNGIISNFTSSMLQQPQLLHVVEALTDVARMLRGIV